MLHSSYRDGSFPELGYHLGGAHNKDYCILKRRGQECVAECLKRRDAKHHEIPKRHASGQVLQVLLETS